MNKLEAQADVIRWLNDFLDGYENEQEAAKDFGQVFGGTYDAARLITHIREAK